MRGIDYCELHVGLNEVKDNEEIRKLLKSEAREGDIDIDPAKESWCAAWMNFCERSSGNNGTGKLNAQSFNDYGTAIAPENAQEGDILVFHFPSDADWQGHVTYFKQWKGTHNGFVVCLGGNQGNEIKEQTYSAQYIRHVRRPNNGS